MSGVPRSQALLQWVSAGSAYSGVWASPAGYITLVKNIVVWNQSAGPLDARVHFVNASGGTQVWRSMLQIATYDTVDATVWIVLNPGDQMFAYASGDGLNFWVSGAILAGPPQFPPILTSRIRPA